MTDAWNEDDTKEAFKNLQNSDGVPETTETNDGPGNNEVSTKTQKKSSKKKKGTVIKMGAQSVSAFGGRPTPSWDRGRERDVSSVNSALVDAMDVPRDRLLVFKIEQNLTKFMMKKGAKSMKFPPLDGNARRLLHLMCGRFQLTSETIETGDYDTKTPKAMRIHKERHSVLPEVRLIEKFGREASSGPQHKLMIRKRGDAPIGIHLLGGKDKRNGADTSGKSNAERLKDKELKYAEAKKRIFAREQQKNNTRGHNNNGRSGNVGAGGNAFNDDDPTLTGSINSTPRLNKDRVVSSSDRPHRPAVTSSSSLSGFGSHGNSNNTSLHQNTLNNNINNPQNAIDSNSGSNLVDSTWQTPAISPVGTSSTQSIRESLRESSQDDDAGAVVAAAVAGAAVNDAMDKKNNTAPGSGTGTTRSGLTNDHDEQKQTVFHKWRKDQGASNFRDHDRDAYDPDFNRAFGAPQPMQGMQGMPGLSFGAMQLGTPQGFGAFQAWGAPQPFMGQQSQQLPYPQQQHHQQQLHSQQQHIQPRPQMGGGYTPMGVPMGVPGVGMMPNNGGMHMQQQQPQNMSQMNQMAQAQGMWAAAPAWNQQSASNMQ